MDVKDQTLKKTMSDRVLVIVSLHIFSVLGIGTMITYSLQKKENWNGFDKYYIDMASVAASK